MIEASNDNSGPVCPVVYVGSDGAFELFWFHPNLHRHYLCNIDSSVDAESCIGTASKIYGVATRFGINPPVMVDSAKIFIADRDPFPELPGDQYSPIRLFLKNRNGEHVFSDVWTREVALDSNSSPGGDIVGASVELSISRDFEVWAGCEWLKSHSSAPLVGICHSAILPEQYIYQRTDSVYNLQQSPEGFMVGLEMLHWAESAECGGDHGNQQGVPTFSILFAADTVDFYGTSVRLDSLGPDSLFSRLDIEESGYARILASNGVDSSASEFIFLDKDKIPNLQVAPPSVDGKAGNDYSDSYPIYLTNIGAEQLCARLIHDPSLMTLSDSAVCLAQSEQVEIIITPEGAGVIDSAVSTDLVIETSDEAYPILYHMILRPAGPTSVSDTLVGLRPAFRVSPASPNPFNRAVEFRLDAGGRDQVELMVFNLLGQRVYEEILRISESTTTRWNGRDDQGRELPSGLYFFRFVSGEYAVTRRALLIK